MRLRTVQASKGHWQILIYKSYFRFLSHKNSKDTSGMGDNSPSQLLKTMPGAPYRVRPQSYLNFEKKSAGGAPECSYNYPRMCTLLAFSAKILCIIAQRQVIWRKIWIQR